MSSASSQVQQRHGVSPTIFVASFLTIFLELALIRWVSSEIRIFAYFKNLVLIACFLGFGTGCFFSRKKANFSVALLLLLFVALLIQLPWQPLKDYGPERISRILAAMPGLMIYRAVENAISWAKLPALGFALAWSVGLFFLLARIIFPFGQAVGASMSGLNNPLHAYSINVAGSLTGIITYSFATRIGLPPVCWLVPAALGCIYLTSEEVRTEVLLICAALLVVLLPNNSPQKTTYWSSYQKLEVVEDRVYVNNIGYQGIWKQPSFDRGSVEPNGATMPYLIRRPPGHVLILGAGTGNDAAVALQAGAASVTAVEIDQTILDIGRELHPQKPYDDPRVRIIVDDARHFLQTNREKYDLIVFSHLDSHTVLSSFTNVRLDDYMYTVESLKKARTHLRPSGILYLTFWSEQPYVTARLARNLSLAFGHGPYVSVREGKGESGKVQLAFFFTGEAPVMDRLGSVIQFLPDKFAQPKNQPKVLPSTDNWPFLPLSHPHIPRIVQLLTLLILCLCGILGWKARPSGQAFDAKMFWLGAAFLLIEVHNVSRLALVFGVTWHVNAWVIGAILSVILLANWLSPILKRSGLDNRPFIYAALFASLAVAYFTPLQWFFSDLYLVPGALATLVLTLPIFFAALIFADAFGNTRSPAFALGWNILGAALGGMTESISYIFGLSSLILIAGVFYALALWSPVLLMKIQKRQTVEAKHADPLQT